MSESMSCWICATIESALDDMAVLLLHNRWVVLPIIAQSRRSFNATMFTCRFRIRPHGLWSHSNDFRLPSSLYEFPYRFTQRFKPLTTCVVLVVNLHKPFGLIGVCRAIEGLVRKSPCVSCLAKLILELQRQKPQALGKLILTRLLCFGSRSSSLVRLVAAHVVWQTRGQTPLRRSGPL